MDSTAAVPEYPSRVPWNFTIGVLRDTHVGELAGVEDAGVSLAEATSVRFGFDRLAVAQTGLDVAVVDPGMGLGIQSLARRLDRQAYVVGVSSASSTFVIEAYGSRTRTYAVSQGVVLEDVGRPLPEESVLVGPEDDGEEAFREVLARLVPGGLGALWSASFSTIPAPAA